MPGSHYEQTTQPDLATCLQRCLDDSPKCHSCDFFTSGLCHLSLDSQCTKDLACSDGSASGLDAEYYEQWCRCALTDKGAAITDTDKTYQVGTTDQIVEFSTQYEVGSAYTAECPIVGCDIYADSACTTAAPEPVKTYVTVGSVSPWAVSINRAYVPGYA